jgi:hypothetical protein
MIGLSKDNPKVLQSAIRYLEGIDLGSNVVRIHMKEIA